MTGGRGGGVMSRSLWNSSNYLDTSTMRFFEQVCQPCNQVGFAVIERLRFTFTLNGKREFVPRDQVFPLIVVNCLLLQLKNRQFHASFIHKNCSGEFLSAYFLF